MSATNRPSAAAAEIELGERISPAASASSAATAIPSHQFEVKSADLENTPIDEKPSEDSKRVDHEPGAATDRPKMTHAATSYGADGRKRRRSIIDRLSFGLLADPWRKRPWGAEWRSSSWFITFVVAFGVATDIMTYSIIVPVAPYRLQSLGYDNVAALNSYLLVAYSAGLVLFTPICAFVFHRFPYRRAPLLGGLVVLQLALVLFAVATPYWCMIVARLLMGIGSAVVWNVGMAMICENVPQEHVGRQLGFAMSGVSIGGSIGPVLGGVLYDRLGWHAPFIFSICICAVEFIGRLIIIERKEVKRWGIGLDEVLADVDGRPLEQTQDSDSGQASPIGARGRGAAAFEEKGKTLKTASGSVRHLTPIEVLVKLSSSPRALTAVAIMFMFALIIGGIDPTLPLRAQDVWNKDSLFVGIIYLVASVPTFFTGPLVGHLADKFGAEWMAAPCLLLSLPFFPLLILKASFAGFVIVFMLANAILSGLLSPLGLELATVAKTQEGIGEIHQFGAMNMAFAIGSLCGPFIGGEIYNAIPNGWTIICWIWMAALAVLLPLVLAFTGNDPLGRRLLRLWRRREPASEREVAEAGAREETVAH